MSSSYFINSELSPDEKLEIINNYINFPIGVRMEIVYNLKEWLEEIFKDKSKIKVHALCPIELSNALPKSRIDVITNKATEADLFEDYNRILLDDSHIMSLSTKSKFELFKIFKSQCSTLDDCRNIFIAIYNFITRHVKEINPDVAGFILYYFLPFKFKGLYLNLNIRSKIRDNSGIYINKNYTGIFDSLTEMFVNMINSVKADRKIYYFNNIALAIYLYLDTLKLEPSFDTLFLIELGGWFDERYVYTIHKKVEEFRNNPSDLLSTLDLLDNTDINKYFKWIKSGETAALHELYDTNRLSHEVSKETLLFGDNIIDGIMSPRELTNILFMMNLQYVKKYCPDGIDDITFKLSEESKMYLKDTAGLKMLVSYEKTEEKTICTIDGCGPYLLFEPTHNDTGTIYGLSIIKKEDNSRDLISIEKDRENYSYKFTLGNME